MDTEKYITGIQHIGIPTNDIDKTVTFYQGLGFEIAHSIFNKAANEKVVFLKMKNVVIETYENHSAVMKVGAIDHIALDVKDIDFLYDKMKASGYNMVHDSVQFLPFWEKGIRFFIIIGPNEEKLEFCEKLTS